MAREEKGIMRQLSKQQTTAAMMHRASELALGFRHVAGLVLPCHRVRPVLGKVQLRRRCHVSNQATVI